MNWNDTDIGFQPITNHSIFVELTLIKNDGRDWTHLEMPIWYFILVKWVCISQSIQKLSNTFQFCKTGKKLMQ